MAVCVVTFNEATDLTGCLEAAVTLTHRPLEIIVVDCASSDETVAVAASC